MNKTFIIAELGINHGGSLKVAKKLIDSAVRSGVDAVKFQTYITEKRVKKKSPIFSILKKCELSYKDFQILKSYSEKKGVEFMSTPFDFESFQFLNDIKVSKIKISNVQNIEVISDDNIKKQILNKI